MSTIVRRSLVPILGMVVVVLMLRFLFMLPEAATRRSDGFAAYYTASRLLREHHRVSDFYDDQWFNAQVGRFVPGVQDIYRPNPPPAVALMLPLARFSYTDARMAWTLINLVLLAAALAIIFHETDFTLPIALAFVALTLVFEPIWVNLRQGQAYIALLFLSAVCWSAFRRRHERTAGVVLGLMLVFKTAGVLLPLLSLRRQRWRALGWCLTTIAFVVLASLVTLGVASWQKYLEMLWRGRNETDLMVTAYQSAYSLSHHLFVYDATWNTHPLFRQPQIGEALALVATLGVLIAVAIILVRGTSDDRSFAALVIAAIVISPYSLAYHYSVMLLPIAILADQLEYTSTPWRWLLLLLGALLVAAPFPYLSPRLSSGVWALLAYPKLLGALLLLELTFWETVREPILSAAPEEVVMANVVALSDA
ncbi:MAG TPA: glycosyltransferase family 87 protein [Nitrolancea sp.]